MWFMSRIITNNYLNKLNDLIAESEISPNFYSFLNFISNEIERDLNRNGSRSRKVFSSNHLKKLKEIQESNDLKRIYAYLKLIIEKFTGHYLHIHINAELSESTINNIVSLFAWEALVNSAYNNEILLEEINELTITTNPSLVLPANNNQRIINQIFKERYGLSHRLKFLKKISDLSKSNLNRGLLLNLNVSAIDCVKLSDYSAFPSALNTYINFGCGLQCIFDENDSILKNIGTIINLFPAERGINIWYKDFLAENINNWNQFPDYEFDKVITITYGEKTPEILLETQRRNKYQADEFYTIFPFEL